MCGLGAILSQFQEDKRLHPVAYASRALSDQEKRYTNTELETLAVPLKPPPTYPSPVHPMMEHASTIWNPHQQNLI